MALTSLSNWKYNYAHQFGIRHVPNPDPYKTLFGDSSQQHINKKTHEALLNTILLDTPGKIAGIIHEPIQGAGIYVIILAFFLIKK
jgi:4-aminobutyrate aminotransferase-like enzyme